MKSDAPKLIVTYDLTGLSGNEIAALSGEAQAQAERNKGDGFGSPGHPGVSCEAILVNVGRELQPSRTVLVRLNLDIPGEVAIDEEQIASEVAGALEVGTDADRTPTLSASVVEVEFVETLD